MLEFLSVAAKMRYWKKKGFVLFSPGSCWILLQTCSLSTEVAHPQNNGRSKGTIGYLFILPYLIKWLHFFSKRELSDPPLSSKHINTHKIYQCSGLKQKRKIKGVKEKKKPYGRIFNMSLEFATFIEIVSKQCTTLLSQRHATIYHFYFQKKWKAYLCFKVAPAAYHHLCLL